MKEILLWPVCRAIAALAVFLDHSWTFGSPPVWSCMFQLCQSAFRKGGRKVDVPFALSGLILTLIVREVASIRASSASRT
jgi:peptidoglycan/LPS O-acetylase OafA/YrhL